jgi:hypothetical protein
MVAFVFSMFFIFHLIYHVFEILIFVTLIYSEFEP